MHKISEVPLTETDEMIREHIMTQINLMSVGEESDCCGLFAKEVWDTTSSLEHRYVFCRTVSKLVELDLVPLVFAGFDKKRHNKYRKN
jgi:hypothetical protein